MEAKYYKDGGFCLEKDSFHVINVLGENGIIYKGEIELNKIGFCKIGAQQGCLTGSFKY